MRRRVAEAARELVSGDRSILELALEYRFESPDGFSRAFRRCFGAAPSEARKAGAYAEGSARTPITRGRVRASMEAGLTIRAERLADVLVAGRPLAPGEAAGPGAELMLLRPGSDPFAGRATHGPADYPLLSARAPGGDYIGVYGDPPLDLGLARDRLYRTAIPRITSYNVCYTKLLRDDLFDPAGAASGIGSRGPRLESALAGSIWLDGARVGDVAVSTPDFSVREGGCSLELRAAGGADEGVARLALYPVDMWTYMRRYDPGLDGTPKLMYFTLVFPDDAFRNNFV